MPSSVAIKNSVEANNELIPNKYKQRWDGRIHLSIFQETFWNMLQTLLVQKTNTPHMLSVGRDKLTFAVEPQVWQSFLTELGLQNDQDVEAFRHLLTTLLRGEEPQTDSPYATLISRLPKNTLTLIAFIGQAALCYPPFHRINRNDDYPYEEGKLTDYWYEQIYRFTTQPFEERIWFREFCLWANIRLKDNRSKLYFIPLVAFIVPARQALSVGSEETRYRYVEPERQKKTPRPLTNELNWNDDPEKIARLLKKTEVSNIPIAENPSIRKPQSSDSSANLFRSRLKQVLATMSAELEDKLTRELEEFESSYNMLRQELATLRNQKTQNIQETAINTLSDLLDSMLRLNSEQLTQIQTEVEKKEDMTRVFLDNIAVGTWRLVGKIGEIVSEDNHDHYLPDPEKMSLSNPSGKLTITRCGLEVNGILLLPPYVTRRND